MSKQDISQESVDMMKAPPPAVTAMGYTAEDWWFARYQAFPAALQEQSIIVALSYLKKHRLDLQSRAFSIVPCYSKKHSAKIDQIWPATVFYLIMADRTNQFCGKDETVFGPEIELPCKDGNFTAPEWASVVVYRMRDGVKCAYSSDKVYFTEFYDKDGFNHNKKPHMFAAKWALTQALRTAFPAINFGPTDDEILGVSIDSESSTPTIETGDLDTIINEVQEQVATTPPVAPRQGRRSGAVKPPPAPPTPLPAPPPVQYVAPTAMEAGPTPPVTSGSAVGGGGGAPPQRMNAVPPIQITGSVTGVALPLRQGPQGPPGDAPPEEDDYSFLDE